MNEATDRDPLIRKQGTLRGLADMFNRVSIRTFDARA